MSRRALSNIGLGSLLVVDALGLGFMFWSMGYWTLVSCAWEVLRR